MWVKRKIFSIKTGGTYTDQQALNDQAFNTNMPVQNSFQISMQISLDSSVRTVPSSSSSLGPVASATDVLQP